MWIGMEVVQGNKVTDTSNQSGHIHNAYYTYFFSRLPAPVSRNPFANGLLSIFNCVIYK